MTITYRDIATGKEIDITIYGNDWLRRITVGLWDRVGGVRLKDSNDCKLVSRIIRNHIHYQNNFSESIFSKYGIIEEGTQFMNDMKNVSIFFENATKGICYPDTDSEEECSEGNSTLKGGKIKSKTFFLIDKNKKKS
jgi:hypothetical protein